MYDEFCGDALLGPGIYVLPGVAYIPGNQTLWGLITI